MNKSEYLERISSYSSEAYSYLHRIRFLANKKAFTDIDLQEMEDYLMTINEDLDNLEYYVSRVKSLYEEVND